MRNTEEYTIVEKTSFWKSFYVLSFIWLASKILTHMSAKFLT